MKNDVISRLLNFQSKEMFAIAFCICQKQLTSKYFSNFQAQGLLWSKGRFTSVPMKYKIWSKSQTYKNKVLPQELNVPPVYLTQKKDITSLLRMFSREYSEIQKYTKCQETVEEQKKGYHILPYHLIFP